MGSCAVLCLGGQWQKRRKESLSCQDLIAILMRVWQYCRGLFNLHEPSEKVRQEAYKEINTSLNKAFALPSLNVYSQSLSLKGLLTKAVEMFVGSRVIPKNLPLSQHLIAIAEAKAQTEHDKNEVEYYKRSFFVRIDAFKTGKQAEFDFSTEMLNKLAEEKGHPQSCYLVGKQLFNVAMTSKESQQQQQMIKLAAFYFEQSLSDNQYAGLFYLGEILRKKHYSQLSEEEVREFFTLGAAMGDPLCYFRLSHLYLQEGNTALYLKYLKLAAETGIIEAQHNLGCEYFEGKHTARDPVKALGWFLHSSANGFIQSKYNIVNLFVNGSECGRIKPNRKAALLTLQELKSAGENVDTQIEKLVAHEEQQQEKKLKQ